MGSSLAPKKEKMEAGPGLGPEFLDGLTKALSLGSRDVPEHAEGKPRPIDALAEIDRKAYKTGC